MSTEIFRKSALETLSSPEQLDQMMKITRPRSWIALSTMALVLVAAILWGIFGALPTTVSGGGIIVSKGGIFNIVSMGNGTISDLKDLKAGDQIKKGQILGHVSQPILTQQIKDAKANLEVEQIASAADSEMQRQALRAKEEQLRSLKLTAGNQASLLRDGLITRQAYEATRQTIDAVQNDIAAAKIALERLSEQEDGIGAQHVRTSQAFSRLKDLQLQYQLASNITSKYDGSLVEIMATNGDTVRDGQPILSVEVEHAQREVMIYLPANGAAERLKPGMKAQISLATYKKERYGYLLGEVVAVSKFPASEQSMMTVFDNAALVHEMSANGAPIAVLVRLIPDSKTSSGYAWSSQAGAKAAVHNGTLCSGSFIVESKRPISLVIPMLKEAIGL